MAHVFLFDIVPAAATPRWIAEGLAEYQRGAWDPADLVALRGGVRANAIPKMRVLDSEGRTLDPRLVYALGHAAFDFIESRWGKPGCGSSSWASPNRDQLERIRIQSACRSRETSSIRPSNGISSERFAASASGQSLAERFDYRTTSGWKEMSSDQVVGASRPGLPGTVGGSRRRPQTPLGGGM